MQPFNLEPWRTVDDVGDVDMDAVVSWHVDVAERALPPGVAQLQPGSMWDELAWSGLPLPPRVQAAVTSKLRELEAIQDWERTYFEYKELQRQEEEQEKARMWVRAQQRKQSQQRQPPKQRQPRQPRQPPKQSQQRQPRQPPKQSQQRQQRQQRQPRQPPKQSQQRQPRQPPKQSQPRQPPKQSQQRQPPKQSQRGTKRGAPSSSSSSSSSRPHKKTRTGPHKDVFYTTISYSTKGSLSKGIPIICAHVVGRTLWVTPYPSLAATATGKLQSMQSDNSNVAIVAQHPDSAPVKQAADFVATVKSTCPRKRKPLYVVLHSMGVHVRSRVWPNEHYVQTQGAVPTERIERVVILTSNAQDEGSDVEMA